MTTNVANRIGTVINRVSTATSSFAATQSLLLQNAATGSSNVLQSSSILLTGNTINSASTASSSSMNASKQSTADSVVHIKCTMNNIQITISNLEGQIISRSSGGVVGEKHRQRASPVAAKLVAEQAANKAVAAGYKVAHVEVKGPSRGRGILLRGLQTAGLRITDIRDVTPVPTNGCRPKAARRL